MLKLKKNINQISIVGLTRLAKFKAKSEYRTSHSRTMVSPKRSFLTKKLAKPFRACWLSGFLIAQARKSYILFFVLVSFFALTRAVSASIFTDNLSDWSGGVFTVTTLFNILNRLACWFIRLGIIAVSVMIIVYGIMFLVSRGNPQGLTNAKKALGLGIVGGLVIFGVFTIILSVAALLGVNYPITTILNCG